MNHAFGVQFCRVVAPEKLSDRFLASGILLQKEGQFIGDQVLLAYILEISKPWFPSSQVLPTLLDTLAEQHAALTPDDTLGDQFEYLLRTLNQQLNSISEQGETDWIGNLHGLIMVLSGDQLHFSQTGRCPAYILQKNRIRQITDDTAPEREPHPLKTFSNLASGILAEEDYILLANHELYREISLDALRRIMNSTSPSGASQAIARELKKEKNPAATSIIIKVVSKGEVETKKAAEPTEVILEEEMQSGLRKFQKKLLPIVALVSRHSAVAGKAGLDAAKKGGNALKKTVAPAAATLVQKGMEQAKAVQEKAREKAATHRHSPSKENQVVEIILPRHRQEEPATPPPSLIPPEELALEMDDPIGLMSTEQPITSNEATPSHPAHFQSFWSWLMVPKRARLVALFAAALLIAGVSWSMLSRRKPITDSPAESAVSVTLQQASDLQKKAAKAIELKQDIEASHEIQQGFDLLNGISSLPDAQKKEADGIWTNLTTSADSISSTTRLTAPTATYLFTTPSQGLVASLPYFYGFSSTDPSLLRTGQGDPSQTQKSITLPDSTDAIISLSTTQESDTAGYALTRKGKVYRITQDGTITSLLALTPSSGDFATADAIGIYIGNIYLLDGKTGLLWKYTNTGTSYAKGVSIIDGSKYDIKNSLSLAIDGSIYLLKQDGTLMKFTSGNLESGFALKNFPLLGQKLLQPVQVITNENMDDLYILDAGLSSSMHSTARVLEFTKAGTFVRQYGFPKEYTQVKAFSIDPASKKLWIVNGNTIGEFDL